jgi:hypothetical protein
VSGARRQIPGRILGELREAVRGRTKEPRISELVQHFFDLAGGERAVAKLLFDAYHSATTTPTVKSKILELVLRSLQFANASTPPRDDLGALAEEDLERELLAICHEAESEQATPDAP